jgi:hypothetical protein
MAPSDSDEVAALRAMGLGRRPAWDGSPLRARPAALKGLQPITREPWAIDEDVYNRRFETRDVGVPGARPVAAHTHTWISVIPRADTHA